MSKRKQPSKSNINEDFCEFLIEIGEYEKNVTRNIYKANAYNKAANTLANHPHRIQSGAEAKKLSGIGNKIAQKIDEFINTGKVRKLETINSDENVQAINLLTKVSGIGPAKAQELVQMGIKTIEDLKKSQDKLSLTYHQILGLKYFEDFEKPIPREEIALVEQKIKSLVFIQDPKFLVTICGSYRRGKNESGDIDVLITHPSFTSKTTDNKIAASLLKKVVEMLKDDGFILDTMSMGNVKFMGVCKIDKIARRLDIRLTPFDQYYCSVLYFTGSNIFNQNMRAHALNHGFTLNEYSLRKIGVTGTPGEPLEIHSEEDIFEYIDYAYKEPTMRD